MTLVSSYLWKALTHCLAIFLFFSCSFGMIHDGEGNPCRKTEGNIMSPTLAGNNGVFFWSTCSRQYLSRFLGLVPALLSVLSASHSVVLELLHLKQGWFVVFTRTTQASCLVDEPKQIGQYKYPETLPGQLYDADTQCKWQFGSKAKLCSLDFVKVRHSSSHLPSFK